MTTKSSGTALKPYPICKESKNPWIGAVPEHWDVVPMSAVGKVKSVTGAPDLPLLSVYLRDGVILFSDAEERRTNPTSENLSNYQKVEPGDLVLNNQQAWRGSVGVSKYQGIVSPAYLVIALNNRLNQRFSDLLFRDRVMVDQYLAASKGVGSIQRNLYWPHCKRASALVPPLQEQAAIVRFLDHADEQIQRYIASKERLIALLEEEYKVATWEAIRSPMAKSLRLGVIADWVRRPVVRADEKTYTPVGLYNRGRGIFQKEPTKGRDLGDSDFFWIQEGDLVISGQFAWEGAIALADSSINGCIASHRYPILRGQEGVSDSRFLLTFFQTEWGQLLLDDHSRGAAGRNRPLNIRTLLKENIPLPRLEDQLRIAGMLENQLQLRQQTRLLEERLREYRTRLIADVVTGQLDVREAAAQLPAAPLENKLLDEIVTAQEVSER